MTQDQTTSATMYCRRCGYQLAGLSENRCPECGQRFHPLLRRSFSRRPSGPRWRWWLRWTAIVLTCLGLLVAAPLGWLYWGWRSEQAAAALLGADPYMTKLKRIGPDWLSGLLGERLAWLLDRVDGLMVIDAPADLDLSPVRRLRHVRSLGIWAVSGRRVDLAPLENVPTLKRLCLENLDIRDDDLIHLSPLRGLEELSLEGTPITDDALTHLEHLSNLKVLVLSSTNVTDAGLVHLYYLPRLYDISIAGTAVTDGGIVALERARGEPIVARRPALKVGWTIDLGQ